VKYVTLVNRSSKILRGTWDGRQYELQPGKHEFPEIQALKFKEQNPVMGTLDPYSGRMDYLIGIIEHNDPLTPIEQSSALQHIDRTKLQGARQVEVVPGDNGLYSRRDLPAPPAATSGPIDSAFVKP
jgi:hypothetical protein